MRTAKYIRHRFRAAAMRTAGGCMSLVRRLCAALSCSRRRDAAADVRIVRLYIRPRISGRLDRQAGKHGKIDPVGTDEIDPVKTA